MNTEIEMADFYCHEYDSRPDANGEIHRRIRSVIVGTDGKMYSFGSRGVFNGLVRIYNIFVRHGRQLPLKIKIVDVGGTDGRRNFTIIPA